MLNVAFVLLPAQSSCSSISQQCLGWCSAPGTTADPAVISASLQLSSSKELGTSPIAGEQQQGSYRCRKWSSVSVALQISWKLCGKTLLSCLPGHGYRPSPLCCLLQAVGRVRVHTYINSALLHFYLKRLCSFQIIACSASQSTFFILQITLRWFQRGLRSSFIAVGRKG